MWSWANIYFAWLFNGFSVSPTVYLAVNPHKVYEEDETYCLEQIGMIKHSHKMGSHSTRTLTTITSKIKKKKKASKQKPQHLLEQIRRNRFIYLRQKKCHTKKYFKFYCICYLITYICKTLFTFQLSTKLRAFHYVHLYIENKLQNICCHGQEV